MNAPHMRYAVSIKDATKCAKEKDINPPMSFTQAEDLLKSLVYKGKFLATIDPRDCGNLTSTIVS